VRAVLVDVGGTLWPNNLQVFEGGVDPRLEPLRQTLPGVDPLRALAALQACLTSDAATQVQDTHGALRAAVRAWATDADVDAVRRALCVPASTVQLFAGAPDLLTRLRNLGVRTVIISNVHTRGAFEYQADFEHFGVGHLIDAVITSLDVGYRKPHRAMFEAAVRAAGCEARECVMVGDSEINDIQPAIQLGMRAIRVAIEEPAPTTSAATAVVTRLEAVADLITAWAGRRGAHR
jgi:HAD superfamily hydrolase (TIGR01509 family)